MPQFPFYSYPKGDIPESIRSTVFSFLHYDTYCSSLFNPLRYARIIGRVERGSFTLTLSQNRA